MTGLAELEQIIRKNLPTPLRQLLRIGRVLASPKAPSSPNIGPELVHDCRFFASRHELIHYLPKHAQVAEIGTDKGLFARHILKTAQPETLHLFDLDFSRLVADVANDRRVRLHHGKSATMLAALPDATLDWIYIDGNHSYEGVTADTQVAARKVKPGGYLVFNDFAHADPDLGRYGVHRAVTEFANASGWPFVMFAYEPSALYDVALRRPPVG